MKIVNYKFKIAAVALLFLSGVTMAHAASIINALTTNYQNQTPRFRDV